MTHHRSRRDHTVASPLEIVRRDALRAGGMGLFGLTMPGLLQATENPASDSPPVRARSIIFLFQWGGPSHIDTFDMKPGAPDGYRSKYGSISTSVPGMNIVEHLPRTAQVMHQFAQIRTVHHRMNNHNSAGYTALTGVEPPIDDQRLRDSADLFPSFGAVVDRVAPADSSIPTFAAFPWSIADGSTTPGQRAGFLGPTYDPLFVESDPNASDFSLPQLSLPAGVSFDRLSDRRRMQQLINRQAASLDRSAAAVGLNSYYERALTMLNSTKVREAFDLSRESTEIREAYGRTTYGQSCLLARRLVETGVRFVTVNFAKSIGGRSKTDGGWDTHGFDNTRMYEILPEWHFPQTDHTLPVLINDLQTRGLLDQTLVVWVGEFGRTPKINDRVSRDHWPKCYTALLAGGGVQGGAVYGQSDRTGAFPDRDPVSIGDLAATMYYAMGIRHDTEIHDHFNRPFPIARGNPVTQIFT